MRELVERTIAGIDNGGRTGGQTGGRAGGQASGRAGGSGADGNPAGGNQTGGGRTAGAAPRTGGGEGGGARRGRSVTVNVAESPLSWLAARGLVDARQIEAGERLRADHETAAIAPSVTMRWAPRVDGGGRLGGGPDPTEARLGARRRFDAAIAAVGPGLADVLWRVVCAGEGLPGAERALGWPSRAGRVVLTLALDRLADHYRLR